MALHPRNPFLGRSVCFLEASITPIFICEALEFADKFGRHVWYLRMKPETTDLIVSPFKQFFKKFLSKMPNLKKLNLHLSRHFIERDLLTDVHSVKSLETLIIPTWYGGYPDDPSREKVEQTNFMAMALGQQLKCLELEFWQSINLKGCKWPNLKVLSCITCIPTKCSRVFWI